MGGSITRRSALQIVGAMTATLWGELPVTARQQRVLSLSLDDVSRIEVRYRGRVATVDPADLVSALAVTAKK